MPNFRYRALSADGSLAAGHIHAASLDLAMSNLRKSGIRPIELTEATGPLGEKGAPKISAKRRRAVNTLINEMAVLLKAGLPLVRALALAIENVAEPELATDFSELLANVRAGIPLSQAMAKQSNLFSPVAIAMTEAGEANGQFAPALSRLGEMLEQAEDLRKLVATSMIYPAALCAVAVGVILLMLLVVVPQFESLFATAKDRLPDASRAVMAASQFARSYGWFVLLAGIGAFAAIKLALRQPQMQKRVDTALFHLPQIGTLIQYLEIARFSRTLGVLIEGNIPLPNAVSLAQKTVANSYISDALGSVANSLKEGSGLSGPMAKAGVLPPLAIGFLRTGEETSQLGMMLARLSDVLDRDVRIRLQRLIGILTPVITVFLGVVVAAIIASIMSAIIGFNELAISS